MRIGLTYDLREDYLAMGFTVDEAAEFDRPDTIEAIEGALGNMGHVTERVGHVRALAERLAAGDRWEMVFNIAEGVRGYGREAQVPALLEAYDIPYTFSDPLVSCLTLHKGMAKRVVRDLGLPTPDFFVVESTEDLPRLNLPFPLFAKPVAEGTSKGVDSASRIRDRGELESACRRLLELYRQPVLVETYLPGREFTVGIVGTGGRSRAIGVAEIKLLPGAESEVYSFLNKEKCEDLVDYRLADDELARASASLAIQVWRGLGCRDAGRVDVRADAQGRPQFIEANPLAGLHPEHSDLPIIAGLTGLGYQRLMEMIMESATERVAAGSGAAAREAG